jgi:hypothetical protein
MIRQHLDLKTKDALAIWLPEFQSNYISLRDESHAEITQAIRYYAFHFDTYLNAASRNRVFQKERLWEHFLEDMDDPSAKTDTTVRENQGETSPFLQLENQVHLHETCESVPDPFKYIRLKAIRPRYVEHEDDEFHPLKNGASVRALTPEDKSILFDYYVATIKHYIFMMFTTLTRYSVASQAPRVLYRGIILFPGDEVQQIRGFTSTTYDCKSIFKSIFAFYQQKIKPEQDPTYIILVMNVPRNIRYVPASLCTLFDDEHEIILVSQCNIKEPSVEARETIQVQVNRVPINVQIRYVDLEIESNYPQLNTFRLEDEAGFWGKKKNRKSKKNSGK